MWKGRVGVSRPGSGSGGCHPLDPGLLFCVEFKHACREGGKEGHSRWRKSAREGRAAGPAVHAAGG